MNSHAYLPASGIRLCEYHASKKRDHDLLAARPDSTHGTPTGVSAELGHFGEARAQAFQELGVKGVARLGQRIVVPRSFLAHAHQAGAPKVAQVARGGRLWNAEDRHEIAHAEFVALQQMKDAQSRPIRKRSEEAINWKSSRLRHSFVAV